MSTIQEQFEQFHLDHPEVYRKLVDLAEELWANGHTRTGIGMLWEVVRWSTMLGEQGGEYKLNNNHRSRYVRLIIANEPHLAELFEIRKLQVA